MNLLDKYVAELGKHLPRKQRVDIEREIHSTLEDMLEERNQSKGQADEAMVMELLKEYGSPREVAAKYKTHQYLIGPRLFPIFEQVLVIVISIVVVASLINLGIGLFKTDLTDLALLSTLGRWSGELFSGLLAAFGNIALIFAIIERTPAIKRFEKEFTEWDPEELKREPDPDQIDLPDHIAAIIFAFLGMVVLNLYPDLIAIHIVNNGVTTTTPILTPAFFHFLPWINIMGLSQIVFHSYMLSRKDWSVTNRILGIVIYIAGLILAVSILKTPGIFGITPAALTSLGLTEAADNLARLFNVIPTILILIITVVTAIKVLKFALQIVKH